MDTRIEVDPSMLENSDLEDYSSYESSGYNSSTASLSSSVHEYVYENGRRYHNYYGVDKDMMPNDEIEQNRLDMHHELMLHLFDGSLHAAPVGKNPQRILDVGTGTGIWAIDMADQHPSAEITGTDLSPIQPSWIPPNCRFEVDDMELPWTFRTDTFDFVHLRNLVQSVSKWDTVLAEVFRCTKPGGFVELSESSGELKCDDGTMAADNGFRHYVDILCNEAFPALGRFPQTGESMKASLEAAGFVDIHVAEYKCPIGPWPLDRRLKKIGAMTLMTMETGLEAYAMAALTRVLGMNKAEAEKVCADAWKAAKNKNTHMYVMHNAVYGRKPGGEEDGC